MNEELFHKVEGFIRSEKERLLQKKTELASKGDIQGFLLIDRDVQVMEITARSLGRYLE